MTDCQRVREWVHQRLDGDLMDAAVLAALETHLDTCAACREFQEELGLVQTSLRGLPVTPLPDRALEAVWDRTVRRRGTVPSRRSRVDWRFAAAAAAIVVTAFLGIQTWSPPIERPEPSRAELRRAAQEMRLVLNVTSQALRKTGAVAVKNVLAEEVSPALRKMPVRWPAGPAAGHRRHES